jgi:hypothetical protein
MNQPHHKASKQPRPTDPQSVWNQSQRILFAVAHQVQRAIRVKLEGHGHAEAELDELVHDAFLAVMEALPRFHPTKAKFSAGHPGSVAVSAADTTRSRCHHPGRPDAHRRRLRLA